MGSTPDVPPTAPPDDEFAIELGCEKKWCDMSEAERSAVLRLGWTEAGLPTDGKSLDAEMMARDKVPTATRWFGLELGGMKVPEEYDD